jgi:glycerate 2-kinase
LSDVSASSPLVEDAMAIASEWLREMNLGSLMKERLASIADAAIDVVAIGKAAREMADGAEAALGGRIVRRLVISEEVAGSMDASVLLGDHPVPGWGSLQAGRRLVAFLHEPSRATTTVFLLSGGASSLCVLPAPSLTLDDLAGVWHAALLHGVDITTLNKIRAATSAIAGGAILREVQTTRSVSLIMVDNVVSGARWVASSMTYDYQPESQEVHKLLDRVGLSDTTLGNRLLAGFEQRRQRMATTAVGQHENVVLADPSLLFERAARSGEQRGYRIVDMGRAIVDDVAEVAEAWRERLLVESSGGERICLLGVGEVSVKVRGSGRGGRCQALAWEMARVLDGVLGSHAFVARASDGRDFVEGVSGAWVDETTYSRAQERGFDWVAVTRDADTFTALNELGQLITGVHTGWNLCDLYVALAS